MLKTAARPSTIPASPEVTLASVRGLDTTLVAEITDCRRRLDAISPEVIALLHEARQLEARAFRAADAIDAYSSEVESRVIEATGAHELMAAAAKVVGAYPVE